MDISTINDTRRELGTISSYREDHTDYHPTCWVFWEGTGSGQGFGGFNLPKRKDRELFERLLMRTFGVKRLKDLKGKKCYALRNRDSWGESIVGLESYDTGFIMTIGQLRKMLDPEAPLVSAREEALKMARMTVEWAERRLEDAKRELLKLENDTQFVDWDKEASNDGW